jgi:hypothetical protein
VQVQFDRRQDHVGIFASTLCAVHCALAAIVSSSAGLLHALLSAELEIALLVVAAGAAAWALARGVRHHGERAPIALGVAGAAAIGLGRLGLSPGGEVSGSILGAALLVSAHVLNLRATARHVARSGRAIAPVAEVGARIAGAGERSPRAVAGPCAPAHGGGPAAARRGARGHDADDADAARGPRRPGSAVRVARRRVGSPSVGAGRS